MFTYDSLAKYLGSRETKLIKRSQLQTSVRQEGDNLVIRLVDTDIMTYYPDRRISLYAGQWRTVTTKARMNDYLPGRWQVYQERNIWYLSVGFRAEQSFTFADGITIMPNNTVENAGPPKSEVLKLSKKVRAYVKRFMNTLADGKVPQPSGGDCWYCLMATTDSPRRTFGEISRSDHILNHIDEGYYVPSLLTRAIEVFPVSDITKWELGAIWQGESPSSFKDVALCQLSSSLKRYIYRQVGLPS